MAQPIVYGPSYSTYVRTVRLALEEKGVAYDLRPVDLLQGAGQTGEHRSRHPFGKVPAFEHDGFSLYETVAITRYVDMAFQGPALQPAEPRDVAVMTQIMAILDSYGYGAIVGKLVWQRLVVPMTGGQPDEGIVRDSLPSVELVLSELERLAGGGGYLVGGRLSLADLHLAPIFAYLSMTPEAGGLLETKPRLRSWWDEVSKRPSVAGTQPQFG